MNLMYTHATVAQFYVKKSATNMDIKLFNKLPLRTRQLDNYKSFKRE
jgi:hypothetical protein